MEFDICIIAIALFGVDRIQFKQLMHTESHYVCTRCGRNTESARIWPLPTRAFCNMAGSNRSLFGDDSCNENGNSYPLTECIVFAQYCA